MSQRGWFGDGLKIWAIAVTQASSHSSLSIFVLLEADQEPDWLMITIVSKEEGQWFEQDQLLNFPGEELLAMDKL